MSLRLDSGIRQDEKMTHSEYAELIMNSSPFRTLSDTKEILVKRNGVYVPRGEIEIEEQCQILIPNCSTYMVQQVIKTIQRSTYTDRERFDRFPHLINVQNGVYDLKEDELRQQKPHELFRIQFPITYDPLAGPKKFMKFLMDCLPDYKDRITVLEEMTSLFLRGLKLEKIYMHVGSGENGKSTIFSIIEAISGKKNMAHISIHDLINHRFARAGLDGKIVNTYAEISNQELKQLGVVKALVSGDPIDVEKKGKEAFTMENFARMFFSANELPEIENFKHAELRRFLVTKWSEQFKANPTQEELDQGIKKRDINLKNELCKKEELSGILNLLLFHAKKLLENEKFTYEQQTEQLQKEWQEKTDHIQEFVGNYLIREEGKSSPKSLVYESYKNWCIENKLISKTERELNSKIKKSFEDSRVKIEGKTTVVWTNMSLGYPVTQVTLSTVPKTKENNLVGSKDVK
jgi:putative DNA primase/helicase